MNRLSFKRKRFRKLVKNILGNAFDIPEVSQIGQNNRKLVATQPRDSIGFANTTRQPVARFLQEGIASTMPQRIVDILEMIEIEKHQSDRCTRSLRLARFEKQSFRKHPSVRQAGNLIKIGMAPDRFFGFFLF